MQYTILNNTNQLLAFPNPTGYLMILAGYNYGIPQSDLDFIKTFFITKILIDRGELVISETAPTVVESVQVTEDVSVDTAISPSGEKVAVTKVSKA